MHIILTTVSLVILCGCILAYVRVIAANDRVEETETRVNLAAMKLRAERDRVTTLERELDALRRELRKLGGKFYATQRETDDVPEPSNHVHAETAPVCENYAVAQQKGPKSEAAQCLCAYCLGRRASKAAFRDAHVPKTAQAQGELARLNAGKP